MNKAALGVVIGALLAVSGQVTQDAFNPQPPPPECTANADVKDMATHQQATIDKLGDLLKKSLDNLSETCKKS